MAPIPGVILVRTTVFSVFQSIRPVEASSTSSTASALNASVSMVPVSLPLPDVVLLPARHLFAALGVDSDLAKRTSMAERRVRAGVRALHVCVRVLAGL
jgi:hypothetical protein